MKINDTTFMISLFRVTIIRPEASGFDSKIFD